MEAQEYNLSENELKELCGTLLYRTRHLKYLHFYKHLQYLQAPQ